MKLSFPSFHLCRPQIFRNPATTSFIAASLILLLGGWQIERGYDVTIAHAYANARNLSRSLAEHSERSIETVDIVLNGLVDRISRGALNNPAQFATFLDKRSKSVRQVGAIVVLDSGGTWILTGGKAVKPGMSSADRAFFQSHVGASDMGLHIGAPIISRIDNRAIIPLSMRWNKPDGSFGGVVMASLDPTYFEDFYRRVGVGANGSIALLSDTRHYLVRHPIDPRTASANLDSHPLFRDAQAKAIEGEMRYKSPVDGVDRIAGYEHLKAYPVTVVAALSVEEVLAPWRREMLLEVATYLIAVALLVVLGAGSYRYQRRTAAAEATIRISEARHRLLTENSRDMISIKPTFGGDRTYVSPASRNVVGWEPEEFAKLPAADFIHPDDFAGVMTHYATMKPDNAEIMDICRVRHKDGRWIWIENTFRLIGAGTADEHVLATARDITGRHQAEEALAASETRYRLLAENSTDMIVLSGLDGSRRYVSPASRDLLGYAPDELIGTRPHDMVHPEDAARLTHILSRLCDGTNDRAASTHRFRVKNGAYIWVEAQFRLIRDPQTKQPSSFVSLVRDVSERHKQAVALRLAKDEAEAAEGRIRESEALYRTLADALPQMVWIARSDDFTLTYSNLPFRTYYGLVQADRDELLTRFHPADLDRIMADWSAAKQAERRYDAEARLLRQDGVYRWHKLVVVPTRRDGVVVEWLATGLDIDDMICAREKLQEATDLLSMSQEAAGAGSWHLDLRGDLRGNNLTLSRESARLHGLADDLIQTDFEAWTRIVNREDADRIIAAVEAAVETNTTYSSEFRVPARTAAKGG